MPQLSTLYIGFFQFKKQLLIFFNFFFLWKPISENMLPFKNDRVSGARFDNLSSVCIHSLMLQNFPGECQHRTMPIGTTVAQR